MLIISPHLDDAVFSCGSMIAKTVKSVTVATICAGIPDDTTPASHFDTAAGFASGSEAIRHRRTEDLAAAATLGYLPVHMNGLSDEYDRGNPDRAEQIAAVTRKALDAAGADEVVVAPVGLRHPDHELVAAVCREYGPARMWLYEELPYNTLWPEFLAPALELAGDIEPVARFEYSPPKEAAIACYATQLIGMNLQALTVDEVVHRCR